MSPPTPSPMTSLTRPVTDKYTGLSRPSLDAFLPSGGTLCGGNRPGYSQYEGTSLKNMHQIGVLLVALPCKSSWKSGVYSLPP